MRELIIIIIVLILIFSTAIITKNYLDRTSDELVGKLENLKQEIYIAEQTKDNSKVKEISEKVNEEWENIELKWALVVLHDELDLIELALKGVKATADVDELGDCMQETEKAMFLIGHIKQKEAFKLKNIF